MYVCKSFRVRLQSRRSSTCYRRDGGERSVALRSLSKACPKSWGLSRNPLGNTIQVSCWEMWVSGSVQVNERRF